jgi:hypothetical protein
VRAACLRRTRVVGSTVEGLAARRVTSSLTAKQGGKGIVRTILEFDRDRLILAFHEESARIC